MPERFYAAAVPKAKALVGQPLARFTGSVTVDGQPLAITGWVGSQNHNWGSRHTDRYAWGQVAGFDDAPDTFLECTTARLKFGPVWTPRMSIAVMRLGDETLTWNSLAASLRARGSYAPYEWRLETSGPAGELAISVVADPADFVALRYDNPPGGAKVCMNSKIARCEATLTRGGTTRVLRSSRTAFEILDDSGPAGVRITV
jgi:hypothetical protein